MNSLPHPIQYQGSKRNLAPVILRYFPKGINRLVEPFAGSAAISIAVAARGLVNEFWINDLNASLLRLLELIIESPEEIADFYGQVWNQQQGDSIGHFYKVRGEFNASGDPRLFLYLLSRCVKGSVRYNAEGLLNQSPDKRRRGTRPETMRKNIMGVSHLLKGKSQFTSLDYKEVLKSTRQDDLIYMDPPYQGVCGNRDARYYSGIKHDEFVHALAELTARKHLFLISYDGRRGDKTFGEHLPDSLGMTRLEVEAGRSSQATLLGLHEVTYESLYLSHALTEKLHFKPSNHYQFTDRQHSLFESGQSYEKTISSSA